MFRPIEITTEKQPHKIEMRYKRFACACVLRAQAAQRKEQKPNENRVE